MPLTDAGIRAAKAPPRPKKLFDGGGLYIYLQPNGSKLWRMSYRFEGKERTLSFGAFPTVGLGEARNKRLAAKQALDAGRDPGKPESMLPGGATFELVAQEWFDANAHTWVGRHADRVWDSIKRDVLPDLGRLPIASIEPQTILKCLRKIEARGAIDTTKRVRQRVGAIMRYAVASGRAQRDSAADIKDALKAPPRVRHQPALKAAEVPEFLRRLRAYDGEPQTALALEFLMRTMTRTGEVRFAQWSEIDGSVWRVPAERMKMHKEHMVPLTAQATALLDRLAKLAKGSPWIAPGPRGNPMSENTMLFGMYRLGYHSRATVHGMRSLASTVLNESGLWRPDAIERQLAHVPENEVRSAYNAALYWSERVEMMKWYNDWLDREDDLADLMG